MQQIHQKKKKKKSLSQECNGILTQVHLLMYFTQTTKYMRKTDLGQVETTQNATTIYDFKHNLANYR